MRATVRAAAAILALAFGAAAGPAGAQSYDGNTIIKFGVFQQSMLLHMQDRLRVDGPVPFVQPADLTDSATVGTVLAGGLSIGIDFHLPYGLLAGFELDGSLGDARINNLHGARAPIFPTDYGFDYLLNLRGRLGYYTRPDLLIYGTAGYSYVGWEAHGKSTGSAKVAETVPGFILGVGLEYEWHHVLLFAEYSHGWYDSRAYTLRFQTPTVPPLPVNERHIADGEVDTIRLGIKFKVGHDHHGWGRWYDPKPLK